MRNLLDFLAKHVNWLLLILLEVASMVLLFRYNHYQGSAWASSANAVAGITYEASSSLQTFFGLRQANELLTLRNVYLEQKVSQLTDLCLSLSPADSSLLRNGDSSSLFPLHFSLISAKVVANSVDRSDNLLTIDKGADDGVRPDMAVACGNGAVGVVYLTSDHYSVVMSLLNINSRISCTIRGKGYFGYLKWEPDYGSEYAYVEDIPRHARFKKGEWIETNGYSSIFPKGVLVGKIVAVYNSDDGLSYRLKVHLSTDFASLRDVCVINDSTTFERARLMQVARDSLNRITK